MKLIKMLGLAAVAAVAAMALLGATSASATVVCKKAPTGSPLTCPAGSVMAAGEKIKGEKTKAGVLTAGSDKIECPNSAFNATLGSAAAELVTNVTALTFSGACTTTLLGGFCSVEKVTTNIGAGFEAKLTYKQVANPQGSFKIKNPSTTVFLNCFGIKENCTYAASNTVEGLLHNGVTENLSVTNAPVTLSTGGSSCPKTGTETVGYHVTDEAGNAVFLAEK